MIEFGFGFGCVVSLAPPISAMRCVYLCISFFSSFFLKTVLVMLFGVCRRMFEVIYNVHGLCMFVSYPFLRSACRLMSFFVCF